VSGNVGHEHDRTLEDTDEQRRTAGVIARDFCAKVDKSLLKNRSGDKNLAKIRILIRKRVINESFAVIGHAANLVQVLGYRRRLDPKLTRCAQESATRSDLGTYRLTARHSQNTLDRRTIRWMALGIVLSQPFANRHAGDCWRRGGEGAGIGRVDLERLSSDVIGKISEDPRLPGEDGNDVSPGHIGEQRENLTSDPVAYERWIGVGRIHHRIESLCETHRLGFRAAQAEDRVTPTRADAGESVGSRPAHEIHEHRLSKVLGSVTKCRGGTEHCVTRRTSACLEVGTRSDRQRFGSEPRAITRSGSGNYVCFGFRTGTDSVIDVDGRDITTRRDREHKKG
jgi:hypothetical protein